MAQQSENLLWEAFALGQAPDAELFSLVLEAHAKAGSPFSDVARIFQEQKHMQLLPTASTYRWLFHTCQKTFRSLQNAREEQSSAMDMTRRKLVELERDQRKRGICHDEESAVAYVEALLAGGYLLEEELVQFMERLVKTTRIPITDRLLVPILEGLRSERDVESMERGLLLGQELMSRKVLGSRGFRGQSLTHRTLDAYRRLQQDCQSIQEPVHGSTYQGQNQG